MPVHTAVIAYLVLVAILLIYLLYTHKRVQSARRNARWGAHGADATLERRFAREDALARQEKYNRRYKIALVVFVLVALVPPIGLYVLGPLI